MRTVGTGQPASRRGYSARRTRTDGGRDGRASLGRRECDKALRRDSRRRTRRTQARQARQHGSDIRQRHNPGLGSRQFPRRDKPQDARRACHIRGCAYGC